MENRRKTVLKVLVGDIGLNNQQNRLRWLEHTLPQIPSGARILDAGAGSQQYRNLCSHLVYVSQDLAEYDGLGDGKGLQTGDSDYGKLDIISDITHVPEPDSSFDAIMCTEVLEHIPSAEAAIAEFARLLKPGGHLILTAPFCSLTHYAPYHFVTGFNRYFYERLLPETGFQVVEIQRNGTFFDYVAQEILRLDSVGKKYSGSGLNLLEKGGVLIMLLALKRLRARDGDSGELLCYGYHVHAIRK